MPLPGQRGRFLFMADQWDVRDLGRSRCARARARADVGSLLPELSVGILGPCQDLSHKHSILCMSIHRVALC
jgi:hypothetical protein